MAIRMVHTADIGVGICRTAQQIALTDALHLSCDEDAAEIKEGGDRVQLGRPFRQDGPERGERDRNFPVASIY